MRANIISVIFIGVAMCSVTFLGVLIGHLFTRLDAIDRGFAHYHPKTGAFTWVNTKESKDAESYYFGKSKCFGCWGEGK